jgi:hypothetical protein
MKQTADMDRIQGEMRPGVITQTGFLGTDKRPLADILVADEAVVLRLGLTHPIIAARMRLFRAAAVQGLGLDMNLESHFEARIDGARGKMPCPFGHRGLFEKTFTIVRNLRLNEEITFTDLNIHMIDEHGFYEGEGAAFRLPPERLVRVLEIT